MSVVLQRNTVSSIPGYVSDTVGRCLDSRYIALALVFFIYYAFSVFLRLNLTFATPILRDKLGFTSMDLGLVTSIFLAFYAISLIPWGLAIDKFGIRRVLLLGFALSLLGISLLLIPVSGEALKIGVFASRALTGIGTASIFIAMCSAIGKAIPYNVRGFVLGLANVGGVVGGMLAGFIYPAIISREEPLGLSSWYSMNMLILLVGIPIAVSAALSKHLDQPSKTTAVDQVRCLKSLLNRSTLLASSALSLNWLSIWTVIGWASETLVRVHSLEPSLAGGLCSIAISVFGIMGSIASGTLTRYTNPLRVFILGTGLTCLGSTAIYLGLALKTLAITILGLITVGFSSTFYVPLFAWMTNRVDRECIGTATAFLDTTGFTGGIIGPIIGAALLEQTHSHQPMYIAAAISSATAIAILFKHAKQTNK